MNTHIIRTIVASEKIRAASDALAASADSGDAVAMLIEALDELEQATDGLRSARRGPDFHGLMRRRATIEEIYLPAAYFDAAYNGEALAELVEELDECGTCGVPRAVTAAVAEKIRHLEYEGLIARVTLADGDGAARYIGVIAAGDLEALIARAIDWADAIQINFIEAAKAPRRAA